MTRKQTRNADTKSIKERLLLLEHTIYGNGAIGLKEQIEKLEKDICKVNKEIALMKRVLYIAVIVASLFFGERLYEFVKIFLKI